MKIKKWKVSVLESKRVVKVQDADFFTSDTDVWVNFQLSDGGIHPSHATIIAYNTNDESLVEETLKVDGNLVKFPLKTVDRSLITHKGEWIISVIFKYNGERYTSREVNLYVNESIGSNIPTKLEIVEDWDNIKDEVIRMKQSEEERVELYEKIKHEHATGQLKGEPGKDGGLGVAFEISSDGDLIMVYNEETGPLDLYINEDGFLIYNIEGGK